MTDWNQAGPAEEPAAGALSKIMGVDNSSATAAAAAQDAAMREAPQQLAQLLVDIDGAIEHAEETATATPSVALPSAVTKTEL